MSLWDDILRWFGFQVADPDDSGPPLPETVTTLGGAIGGTPSALPASASAPTPGDDPIVGPAFPWLARWTPDDRRALLEAQTAVGLDPKIGGLLAVIDHESGGKPDALNPLPAAGLIQLTRGANLPGFTTTPAVRAVATWTPARQLRDVVLPFYRRMFPSGAGSSQGGVALLRKNFLPAVAGEADSFVLAVNPGSTGPNGETSNSTVSGLSRGAIYKSNYGFDPGAKMANGTISGGRGYFTWADADKQAAASVARGASHGLMRVSGAVQPADPPMAGWRTALFGCTIPTHRRHGHTCPECGHSWFHDPDPCIGKDATAESCDLAHVCPRCGAAQYRVDLALCGKEDPVMAGGDTYVLLDPLWLPPGVRFDSTSAQQVALWKGADYATARAPDRFWDAPGGPKLGWYYVAGQPDHGAYYLSPSDMVPDQQAPIITSLGRPGVSGYPENVNDWSYGIAGRSTASSAQILRGALRDPAMRGAALADLDPIQWVEIDAPGGYRVKTTAEPLSVGGVRLPMSFGDLIRYAVANNALPLTKVISQARWAQAIDKRLTTPVASSVGAIFNNPAQNATFAASLGPIGHVLRDGGWKEMIIDPAKPLTQSGPNSMVFYGWHKPDGTTFQKGISSDHNRQWVEYDSFGSLVSRDATKDGQPVDLLAEIAKGGPLGGPLAAWLVEELSGGPPAPGPLASSSALSQWSES